MNPSVHNANVAFQIAAEKNRRIAELETELDVANKESEQYLREKTELEAELRKTVLGYETENQKLREALNTVISADAYDYSKQEISALVTAALEVKDD